MRLLHLSGPLHIRAASAIHDCRAKLPGSLALILALYGCCTPPTATPVIPNPSGKVSDPGYPVTWSPVADSSGTIISVAGQRRGALLGIQRRGEQRFLARSLDGGVSWEASPLYEPAFLIRALTPDLMLVLPDTFDSWMRWDVKRNWLAVDDPQDCQTAIKGWSSTRAGDLLFIGVRSSGAPDCKFSWNDVRPVVTRVSAVDGSIAHADLPVQSSAGHQWSTVFFDVLSVYEGVATAVLYEQPSPPGIGTSSVLVSQDGGISWRRTALVDVEPWSHSDAGNGSTLIAGWRASNPTRGVVIVISPDGRHFESELPEGILSAAMDSTGRAWSVSGAGSYYMSTDAGKTWSRAAAPAGAPAHPSFTRTTDAEVLLVAGGNVYAWNGSNWGRVNK